MLKKRVLDTVRKHNLINMGDHIVIGLSGGPDSVCLFHVLKDLSAELGCTLQFLSNSPAIYSHVHIILRTPESVVYHCIDHFSIEHFGSPSAKRI